MGIIFREKGLGSIAIIVITASIVVSVGAGVIITQSGPSPNFKTENLSINQTEVGQGNPLNVNLDVANIGDNKGTHKIILKIDNETYKTSKVTLGPDEDKTVSLDVTENDLGNHTLSIEDLSEPFEVVKIAEFEVSDISISPTKVEPNDSVSVSVNVSNVGNKSGEYSLDLKVDGTTEDTQTVSLNSGEETTVTFTFQRETKKTYSVEIGDLSQSFEVVTPAEFEVSNLKINSSQTEGQKGTKVITQDDFSSSSLHSNLSLKYSARFDQSNNRIYFADAEYEKGRIIDSAFSNTIKNWVWEGRVKMGVGRIDMDFYAPESGREYWIAFRQFHGDIVLRKDGPITLSQTNYPFKDGDYYDLKVKYREGEVTAYVDGKKELTETITQPDYTGSKFFVNSFNAFETGDKTLEHYKLSKIVDDKELGTIQSISADVSNIGDLSGEYTVNLEVDGTIENTQTISLNEGENRKITFSLPNLSEGTHNVSIDGLSDTIETNSPPSATASASKTSGVEPLTVNFTGSGTDAEGSIKSYSWDFGDGSTSSNQNPPHTFDSEGTYNVTLTVTDDEGTTDSDTLTISVTSQSEGQILTFDDFSGSTLNGNLSLIGLATHEQNKSRINLTDATPSSTGGVVDSAFSNDLRNWTWKSNAMMGGAQIKVKFYTDGQHWQGKSGTEKMNNGYRVRFNEYRSYIYLDKIVGGNDPISICKSNYNFQSGDQYDLKVKFLEGEVTAYVNGSLQLSHTLDSPDYTYDGFVVSAWSGSNPDLKTLEDYKLSQGQETSTTSKTEPDWIHTKTYVAATDYYYNNWSSTLPQNVDKYYTIDYYYSYDETFTDYFDIQGDKFKVEYQAGGAADQGNGMIYTYPEGTDINYVSAYPVSGGLSEGSDTVNEGPGTYYFVFSGEYMDYFWVKVYDYR